MLRRKKLLNDAPVLIDVRGIFDGGEAERTGPVIEGYEPCTGGIYERDERLDAIERIALSFGLSIALVPLLGLAFD